MRFRFWKMLGPGRPDDRTHPFYHFPNLPSAHDPFPSSIAPRTHTGDSASPAGPASIPQRPCSIPHRSSMPLRSSRSFPIPCAPPSAHPSVLFYPKRWRSGAQVEVEELRGQQLAGAAGCGWSGTAGCGWSSCGRHMRGQSLCRQRPWRNHGHGGPKVEDDTEELDGAHVASVCFKCFRCSKRML